MKFIIPLAALFILPSWAKADEPYVGWKSEPRANLYQKVSGSPCGRYITPQECRKIRARNESRRRNAEDRQYSDYRDRDPGGSCRAPISVEGRERGTEGRAVESAWNAWENSVRSRHGYAFANRAKARGGRPDCNPSRTNLFGQRMWVCALTTRPCRD